MKEKQMADNRLQLLLNIGKIVMIVLILIFVVSIYNSVDKDSDALVSDVAAAVFGETVPAGSQAGTELEFRDVYGLDMGQYEGAVYYRPVSNMDVTEIVIAKSDSDDALNALVAAAQERVDDQKSVFEGYAPEQYGILEDAVISKKGNYVFFIVSADADGYYDAAVKAIE